MNKAGFHVHRGNVHYFTPAQLARFPNYGSENMLQKKKKKPSGSLVLAFKIKTLKHNDFTMITLGRLFYLVLRPFVASKMAQQSRAPVPKPDDLTSIPSCHHMERKDWLQQSRPLTHKHAHTHTCMHTSTGEGNTHKRTYAHAIFFFNFQTTYFTTF